MTPVMFTPSSASACYAGCLRQSNGLRGFHLSAQATSNAQTIGKDWIAPTMRQPQTWRSPKTAAEVLQDRVIADLERYCDQLGAITDTMTGLAHLLQPSRTTEQSASIATDSAD